MEGKFCNLAVLVTPAEDLPGVWVSHCLPLDLISQGESIEQAVEAIAEVILMVVDDDLKNNQDPLARDSAPREYWEMLEQIRMHGVPVEDVPADATIRALVTYMRVERTLHLVLDPEVVQLPQMWQVASLESLRCGPNQHA